MKETKTFENDPAMKGFQRLVPDIVYTNKGGGQRMTLVVPWTAPACRKLPLVVFVQGSAWTKPNMYFELPQLCELARRGYIVATIEHRSAVEGHAWPAYLEDTKCAIRYLRAHAEEYGIDKERVCIYGTSSGGNTALLVAVTGDDVRFVTDEYADESDAVQLAVDCFGPTYLPEMIDLDPAHASEDNKKLMYGLAGAKTPEETILEMSPTEYLKKGAALPPILMLRGDADPVVPYAQSELMLERLLECGADARLVRVRGGVHEGNFWSRPLLEEIYAFIAERL